MHAHTLVARRAFTYAGKRFEPGDVFDQDVPGYKLRGLQTAGRLELRPVEIGNDDDEASDDGDEAGGNGGRRRRRSR